MGTRFHHHVNGACGLAAFYRLRVARAAHARSRETNVPVDQLATSPELRETFAAKFRARTGQANTATDEMIRLLLRLRKQRQLPRLRR